VESEQLMQTMVKLQAVQGAVNAVNTIAKNLNSDAILGIQLRNGLEKIKTALTVENTVATGANAGATVAMTTAQKAATVATNLGTLAMKALNAVIKANPIFLLIAALAAVAGAFIAFSDNSEDAKKSNDEFTKSLENSRRAADDSFNALQKHLDQRVKLLEASGASDAEVTKQQISNLETLAKARQDDRQKEQYAFQNLRKRYKQMLDQGNEDEASAIREQLTASRERYSSLSRQAADYYKDIKFQRELDLAENKKKVEENAKKVYEEIRVQIEKEITDNTKKQELFRANETALTEFLKAENNQRITDVQVNTVQLLKEYSDRFTFLRDQSKALQQEIQFGEGNTADTLIGLEQRKTQILINQLEERLNQSKYSNQQDLDDYIQAQETKLDVTLGFLEQERQIAEQTADAEYKRQVELEKMRMELQQEQQDSPWMRLGEKLLQNDALVMAITGAISKFASGKTPAPKIAASPQTNSTNIDETLQRLSIVDPDYINTLSKMTEYLEKNPGVIDQIKPIFNG